MIRRILFLLTSCVAIMGCSDDPQAARERRAELVRQSFMQGGEVHLGVVWNGEEDGFVAGARLAAEEINSGGGVLGRRLVLKEVDEMPFLADAHVDRAHHEGRYRSAMQQAGVAIANAALEDPRIAAVIGHSDAGHTTLSAMQIYDANRVLLLSAGTVDSRVRWMESEFYFQLRSRDEVQVAKMADLIQARRWGRVHVVYLKSVRNEHIAELLKSALAARGIVLAGTTALHENATASDSAQRRLQTRLIELREDDSNAMILLAPPKLGGEVVRLARSLGIVQPVLGNDGLASPLFGQTAKEAGIDTLATTPFRNDSYLAKGFAKRFGQRYGGRVADAAAALGYDSVRLYSQGVECAGATDARLVADALHFKLPLWYGVIGPYTFQSGENQGMPQHVQVLRRTADGRFDYFMSEKIGGVSSAPVITPLRAE